MEERLWKEFIECSCYCHAIGISYETDEEEGLPLFDMGFFAHGDIGDVRWSIKERIRYAWQILRTGKLFTDQVTLNRTEAKRLKCSLDRFLDIKYIDVLKTDSEKETQPKEEKSSNSVVTFVDKVLDTFEAYFKRLFR